MLALLGWGTAPTSAEDPIISEVYPTGVEFVELRNPGSDPVALAGFRLVGDVQHVFGVSAVIPPGGFFLLAHGRRELAAEFGEGVVLGEELWGRLGRTGVLRLYDPDDRLVDWVKYEAGDGRSLQRRSVDTPYRGQLNWALAAPTPGLVNGVDPGAPPLAIDLPERASDGDGAISLRVHGAADRVRVEWQSSRGGSGTSDLVRDGPHPGGGVTFRGALPAHPGGAVLRYSFVAEGACGAVRLAESPAGEPFRSIVRDERTRRLPVLALELTPAERAALDAGEVARATLVDEAEGPRPRVIEGVLLVPGGGGVSRRWPKRSWTVRLPRGVTVRGRDELKLRTLWRDPSYLREVLALDVYRRCGVVAPEARLVRVEVNREFFGLYTEVEEVDAHLLERVGLAGAALFSGRRGAGSPSDGKLLATPVDYALAWDASAGASHQDLRAFLEALHEDVERCARERLDLDGYLAYLAASTIVSAWDNVERNAHWCFDRLGQRRWSVIPWDLDRTWGDHFEGGWSVATSPIDLGTRARPVLPRGRVVWDEVRERVLGVPALRTRYQGVLARLLETSARPEVLELDIDQRLALIEEDVLLDRARWSKVASKVDGRLVEMPYTAEHLRRAGAQLKRHVRERALFLRRARAEGVPSGPAPREQASRNLRAMLLLGVGLALYGAWARAAAGR